MKREQSIQTANSHSCLAPAKGDLFRGHSHLVSGVGWHKIPMGWICCGFAERVNTGRCLLTFCSRCATFLAHAWVEAHGEHGVRGREKNRSRWPRIQALPHWFASAENSRHAQRDVRAMLRCMAKYALTQVLHEAMIPASQLRPRGLCCVSLLARYDKKRRGKPLHKCIYFAPNRRQKSPRKDDVCAFNLRLSLFSTGPYSHV